MFTQTSFREPALSSASQAGLVNNLNDGLAWGLFPLLFAAADLSVAKIGVLAALYPAVWGAGQLFTGALSDRWGRKWLITVGMWLQAVALGVIALADGFTVWAFAAVLLGAGTAMVYPTLLASIGDVAHPAWRARSVGIYRLWRDGGFAVGALLAGVVADALGVRAAIWAVAVLTAASGLVVASRMYETHRRPTGPSRTGHTRRVLLTRKRGSTEDLGLLRLELGIGENAVLVQLTELGQHRQGVLLLGCRGRRFRLGRLLRHLLRGRLAGPAVALPSRDAVGDGGRGTRDDRRPGDTSK